MILYFVKFIASGEKQGRICQKKRIHDIEENENYELEVLHYHITI